jgi:hypothetical protein
MQQEQPQFYASLASHLSADEQNVIQAVFNQADEQMVLAQQQQAGTSREAVNGGAS